MVKRFQTAGLAECEAFMLQEIKLVLFTNHPNIIKAFAAQLKPIPSLLCSYWNGNTLFGHLETIKTEGIDGFEDEGRKMASLGLHPNATDASVQRRLGMLGPLLDFCKNRLELAYAFLCIMAYAGKEAELLHSELSSSNVMFHFGVLDDVHRVFIGIIDWGRANRPKEKIHSQNRIC